LKGIVLCKSWTRPNMNTGLHLTKVNGAIDKDKGIVQLRRQKALAAEKDTQKHTRLQSALKALAEASFRN